MKEAGYISLNAVKFVFGIDMKWGEYFLSERLMFKFHLPPPAGCAVHACHVTSDRRRLHTAHALLMHAVSSDVTDNPLPPRPNPDQVGRARTARLAVLQNYFFRTTHVMFKYIYQIPPLLLLTLTLTIVLTLTLTLILDLTLNLTLDP